MVRRKIYKQTEIRIVYLLGLLSQCARSRHHDFVKGFWSTVWLVDCNVCVCMRCIKIFRRNRNNHSNNIRSCHHQLLRLLNAVSRFTFMHVHTYTLKVCYSSIASRLCLYFSLGIHRKHCERAQLSSAQLWH